MARETFGLTEVLRLVFDTASRRHLKLGRPLKCGLCGGFGAKGENWISREFTFTAT